MGFRNIFFLFLLLGIILPAVPAGAQALFLEIDGYYRLRSTYLYRALPEDDDDTKEENVGFFAQRLRLEPTVVVEERVRVHTQLDVFDDLVWGSRTGYLDDPVGDSESYRDISGEEGDALVVRRAWTEIESPYGTFRVGRQPWHWGLGVFLHSGDGLELEFGDRRYGETRDRIGYHTPPVSFMGDAHIILAYDKLIEDVYHPELDREGWLGWLSDPNDDLDEWIAALSWQREAWDAGVAFAYQRQNSPHTRVWVINPYGRYSRRIWYAEGEGRVTTGDTKVAGESVDVQQYGGLLRLGARPRLKSSHFDFGVTTGFASGDSGETGAGATYFAPDYRLDVLLYSEVIDFLSRQGGSLRATRGGVTNSLFVRPYFSYVYPRWVSVLAGVVWAYPDEVDGVIVSQDKTLGLEFDAGVELRLTRRASAGLELGYLFAGDGLGQEFDNSFALRGKFQVVF